MSRDVEYVRVLKRTTMTADTGELNWKRRMARNGKKSPSLQTERGEAERGTGKRETVQDLRCARTFSTEANGAMIIGANEGGCFAHRPSVRPSMRSSVPRRTPPGSDGPHKLIGMLGRDATSEAVCSDVMLAV